MLGRGAFGFVFKANIKQRVYYLLIILKKHYCCKNQHIIICQLTTAQFYTVKKSLKMNDLK